MKILFTPNDIGGGFGHVSRCLAVAEYYKTAGATCAFLMHNQSVINKLRDDFTVIRVPVKSVYENLGKIIVNYLKPVPTPLFITVPDLSYQVIRDGFSAIKIVHKVLNAYLSVLNQFKPDFIICDTNLLIGIAAKILDIPVIQITRKAFYPRGSKIIWWQNNTGLIPPDISTLFNQVLEKYNLSPISKAEELLTGALYFVPSIPELEPGMQSEDTFYIGSLLREEKYNRNFNIDSEGGKNIYITIGAGAVGHLLFFDLVQRTLGGTEYSVTVSAPDKFIKQAKRTSPNIRYYNWVPGRQVIQQSDLIIFHGGYGTMMETIEAGTPSLVIPFHSEQESNGRRLRDNGCSELCKLSNQKEIMISRNWQFGQFSYAVQNEFTLSKDELSTNIEKLLEEDNYKKNIRILQDKLTKYNGPAKLSSIIQDRLGVL